MHHGKFIPRHLDFAPVIGAQPRDCFPVVQRQIDQHGGSICYGWQIWEWPDVFIEAEFHAVWRDTDGKLHDITPKDLPFEQILFLEDPIRRYEGKQVNNIRRAISSRPEVQEFIDASDADFEFMNRGERANQDSLSLTPTENAELMAIKGRALTAYKKIIGNTPKLGRNDPCSCGGGKKYKKCHGA
jgi:hypothetical protein